MIDKIKQFIKERDAACLSFDVKTFREFYKRWMDRGVYTESLPDDDMIVEIVMRKCVVWAASATGSQKQTALNWLLERGYTPDMG